MLGRESGACDCCELVIVVRADMRVVGVPQGRAGLGWPALMEGRLDWGRARRWLVDEDSGRARRPCSASIAKCPESWLNKIVKNTKLHRHKKFYIKMGRVTQPESSRNFDSTMQPYRISGK